MTRRDDEPRYMQVAASLRAQIEQHRLLPGQTLPSENTLATTYGVVRMTVRRALDQLRAEGLIVTTHGRGSAVRDSSAFHSLDSARYRDEVRQALAGSRPGAMSPEYAVETTVAEMPADDDLAHVFRMAAGTPLLKRRRLALWMRTPQVLTTSHFPLDLVAGTPLAGTADNVGGNIYELAQVGVRVTAVEESKHARLPTDEERKTLKIVMPAAVLAVVRRMYAGDRLVEYARDIVYPGDRVHLVDRIDLTGEWP